MLWAASVMALTLSIIAALLHSSYRALGCTMVTVHQSLQRKQAMDRGIRDLSSNGSLRRGARYAALRTGLCHIPSRSPARRNGNWKMASRDRRPKTTDLGPKASKLPARDLGHARFRSRYRCRSTPFVAVYLRLNFHRTVRREPERASKKATGEAHALRFTRTTLASSLTWELSSPVTGPGRLRCHGSDDPIEIGVRSGVAVDRNMRGNIELQPLDVVEQRNGVCAHIRRRWRALRRRPIEIRVDENLFARQIGDQHVVAVIETLDVVQHYTLLSIADRVLIRERLQRQRTGTSRCKWGLRQPVGTQGPRLWSQDDPLIEVSVPIVRDDGCAFSHIGARAAQMVEMVVGVDEIPDRLVGVGLL